jgi:sugar lactone lactonase YvrE
VVERGFLAEIDIGRGEVIARYELPGAVFPNDVVVDQDGSIYVSDTSPNGKIFRLEDGDVEVWLTGEEVNRVNGLFIHDGELLMGSSGDGFLKAVNLNDKSVRNVVCLGAGIIDGIRVTAAGNYLVSHWEGQVYEITPSGEVVEVLDVKDQNLNVADFEFLMDRNLLLAPTYMGNRVAAYTVRP